MIVEVVGGVYAHSLAIITDAAHLLSDVSGFAVAAFAAFWAARRSKEHFSYGYHRVEVLGALASVMTVWLVTGILLVEAIQRIITPEEVDGKRECRFGMGGRRPALCSLPLLLLLVVVVLRWSAPLQPSSLSHTQHARTHSRTHTHPPHPPTHLQ